MNDRRPRNLDLTTIHQPVPAIASIAHRITGVALFIGVGFMIWAFDLSLESRQGFEQVAAILTHPLAKLITWGILSFLMFHLIAGIRHLIMDAGFAETLEGGRLASHIVFGLSAVVIVLLGVWVW